MEEDQDEIEDLTGRQRALISQNTQLQTQLSEVHQQVAELEESNVNLESKVGGWVCGCATASAYCCTLHHWGRLQLVAVETFGKLMTFMIECVL